MSYAIKDRWLWLGLGLALVTVTYITNQLAHRAQEAALAARDRDAVSTKPANPRVLPLSTLKTLMRSPNPNISQMAEQLVLNRLQEPELRNAVFTSIGVDSLSSDEAAQRRAKIIIDYLVAQQFAAKPSSPTLSEATTSSPQIPRITLPTFDEDDLQGNSVPFAGWTTIPRERPLPDEQAIRRRRREAVVLHEGSGEINENDIIRPMDLRSPG